MQISNLSWVSLYIFFMHTCAPMPNTFQTATLPCPRPTPPPSQNTTCAPPFSALHYNPLPISILPTACSLSPISSAPNLPPPPNSPLHLPQPQAQNCKPKQDPKNSQPPPTLAPPGSLRWGKSLQRYTLFRFLDSDLVRMSIWGDLWQWGRGAEGMGYSDLLGSVRDGGFGGGINRLWVLVFGLLIGLLVVVMVRGRWSVVSWFLILVARFVVCVG